MKSITWGVIGATLAVAAISCGGSGKPRPTRTQAATPSPSNAEYADENSVDLPADRLGRWRWRGKRKDCFYEVKNRCFLTERSACKSAGCSDLTACETDGAGPVRVSCREAPKAEAKSESESSESKATKSKPKTKRSKRRRRRRKTKRRRD